MGKTYLLVDGHYLIHRVLNNPRLQELKNHSGTPTGGVFGFLKTLHSAAKHPAVGHFDKLIVAFDRGNSERRKALFPEYRVRPPKEEETTATDEDGEAMGYHDLFLHQKKYIMEWVQAMGAHTVEFHHREADDIIAWFTQHCDGGNRFVIVSDDRDFLQLLSDNVHVFRPMANSGDGEYMTPKLFKKQMGFKPARYVLFKSLVGDASDMVPGIIGEVTATNLVKEAGKSLSKVKSELKELAKSKRNKKLFEAGPKKGFKIVKRNLKLFNMHLEEFDSKEEKKMRRALEKDVKVDWGTLRRIAEELQLDSVKTNLGRWMAAFR